MSKKTIEDINSDLCKYNYGVDCARRDCCNTCGFSPLEHAKRVTEMRNNILPYFINKADTEIIRERIRRKNV